MRGGSQGYRGKGREAAAVRIASIQGANSAIATIVSCGLGCLSLIMPTQALGDSVCVDSRPDMERLTAALQPLAPRLSPNGRFAVQKVEKDGIPVRVDIAYIVGAQVVFRHSVPVPQDAALAIWPQKNNNAALGVGYAYGAGGRSVCEWVVYPKGGRYVFAQTTVDSASPAPPQRSAAAQAPKTGAPAAAISAHGIGPIRFRMTIKEASAAASQPFWVKRGEGGPCNMAGMKSQPDLSFTLDRGGRIQSVCTRGNRYATDSGIRVGDPAEKVKRAYQGRLKVDGNYLTATMNSGYAISFNAYDGKVNEICSGHASITDTTGC